MKEDLDQRQWTQLSQAIREGKCIIFLGPGATVNFGAPLRQAQFFEEIASKNPKDILAYHPQDGFLVFKDTKTRSLYESEIRDFYQAKVANPLLQKLARIPFSVVISVTPDQYIKEAFDSQNFAYFDQHYATKVKVPLRETPSAQRPLLYNLVGCVMEPHTIIASHADLFSYLQSIFGDKNLPDELTTLFNSEKTKSIVFLGFEFDKWYFQLILHVLGIKIDSCWRYAVAQSLPLAQNKTLVEAQYEIQFVGEDLVAFADNMIAQFDPAELRKPVVQNSVAVKYNSGNVMKFLVKAFSSTDFDVFCLINFPEVHQEFADGMTQTQRVGLLFKYAERHGRFLQLLEAGRAENDYQFNQCGPYVES